MNNRPVWPWDLQIVDGIGLVARRSNSGGFRHYISVLVGLNGLDKRGMSAGAQWTGPEVVGLGVFCSSRGVI
jgi:hypothetical protein